MCHCRTYPRLTTEDLAAGPPLAGRPPAPTLVAELGAGIARSGKNHASVLGVLNFQKVDIDQNRNKIAR